MTDKKEVKEESEVPKTAVKVPKIVLTPEQIASRQRAHDIKVAKFLAGGEF